MEVQNVSDTVKYPPFEILHSKESSYSYIHRLLTVQDHLVSQMEYIEDIFLQQDYQRMVAKLDECIRFLGEQALQKP